MSAEYPNANELAGCAAAYPPATALGSLNAPPPPPLPLPIFPRSSLCVFQQSGLYRSYAKWRRRQYRRGTSKHCFVRVERMLHEWWDAHGRWAQYWLRQVPDVVMATDYENFSRVSLRVLRAFLARQDLPTVTKKEHP